MLGLGCCAGFSPVVVHGLFTAGASFVVPRGLLSLCHAGSRAHTSVAAAPGLQSAGSVLVGMGLVAPRPVGSSRAGHGTRVPCIGRRILSHKESHYFLVRMLQVLQAALMPTDT